MGILCLIPGSPSEWLICPDCSGNAEWLLLIRDSLAVLHSQFMFSPALPLKTAQKHLVNSAAALAEHLTQTAHARAWTPQPRPPPPPFARWPVSTQTAVASGCSPAATKTAATTRVRNPEFATATENGRPGFSPTNTSHYNQSL